MYVKHCLHVFMELSAVLHLWPNLFSHSLSFFLNYYSASFEVDVNCWWNQALHVDPNVSVVCHTSANSCDLCQIYVITPGHRHLLPSTCASTKETFIFSIAAKHTGHIRCMCNGNMADTCNVTVRGGCEYHIIDHLSQMTFGNVLGFISFTYKCLCLHDTHKHKKGIVY